MALSDKGRSKCILKEVRTRYTTAHSTARWQLPQPMYTWRKGFRRVRTALCVAV